MKANKSNNAVRAYNHAVYSELQNRGQAPDQALRTFKKFYRPLRQTWGLELNPEALAEEMMKLQLIKTTSQGSTVTIKPHFRTSRGQQIGVKNHKRARVLLASAKKSYKLKGQEND